MGFAITDCCDCGGCIVIGKWFFCIHNHMHRIIVLPIKGQCNLKPNNAQQKLK